MKIFAQWPAQPSAVNRRPVQALLGRVILAFFGEHVGGYSPPGITTGLFRRFLCCFDGSLAQGFGIRLVWERSMSKTLRNMSQDPSAKNASMSVFRNGFENERTKDKCNETRKRKAPSCL